MHQVSETISSTEYLWSIKGMAVLSKARCLAPFEILPSGAVPDGDRIPAGPVISVHSGWMYWRLWCVSNGTEHLYLDT